MKAIKSRQHLDASLHRLLDRLPRDDAGRLQADPELILGANGPFAVDGVAEGVHDTAQQLHANGNVDDGAGTLDDVPFLDQLVVS